MAQRLSVCRTHVRVLPGLTADERHQLAALCRTALVAGGSHSPAAVAAERRICLTIVRDSGVTGAAAAAAEQDCEAPGGPSGPTGPTGATGGPGAAGALLGATGATSPAAAAGGLVGFGSAG